MVLPQRHRCHNPDEAPACAAAALCRWVLQALLPIGWLGAASAGCFQCWVQPQFVPDGAPNHMLPAATLQREPIAAASICKYAGPAEGVLRFC